MVVRGRRRVLVALPSVVPVAEGSPSGHGQGFASGGSNSPSLTGRCTGPRKDPETLERSGKRQLGTVWTTAGHILVALTSRA